VTARATLLFAALLVGACGPSAQERALEHVKKGTALVAEGKYDAAVAELTKAVEANRDSIEAHTQLGNAYRGLKQYDKAIDAYRAAKKIDRYRPAPHVENARALVEMGQIEPAIEQLNHVIELDPKHLEAMLLLGRVSMTPRKLPDGSTGVPKESVERAELNLETAVGLAPENAAAHRELALAREALGKKDAAREAWTRVRDVTAGKPDQAKLAGEASDGLDRLKR
jgi:tetratricopeptide (TPR) repeat protein